MEINELEQKILKLGKKVLDEIYLHNHDIDISRKQGKISIDNDLIYVNSHLLIILDSNDIKNVKDRCYDRIGN